MRLTETQRRALAGLAVYARSNNGEGYWYPRRREHATARALCARGLLRACDDGAYAITEAGIAAAGGDAA